MTLRVRAQHVTCTACGFGTAVLSDSDATMSDWMCPRCQFQLCPRCGSVDRKTRRMVGLRESDLDDTEIPSVRLALEEWAQVMPCTDPWHAHRPITVAHEIPRDLLKFPQPREIPEFDRVLGISDLQLWLLGAVLIVLLSATAVSTASILFAPV